MVHFSNLDLINLFFLLGIFASWAKLDLEIPETVSTFLSMFLLLSLGLKGGHEVRFADNLVGFLPIISIGLISCLAISTLLFLLLKNRFGIPNASALAAFYGPVSAVTFVTAQGILENEVLISMLKVRAHNIFS